MFSNGIFIETMVPIKRIQDLAERIVPLESDFPLVRLGANYDGGYLVPDDLAGIRSCFSPGVDTFATFEADLLLHGIGSHLADHSVEKVPDGLDALSFTKKFIGANTSGNFISLQDWVSHFETDAEADQLLLQMDIEGAEYAALLACPIEILKKFRIMVVEFHAIESWGHSDFFNIVEACFDKLLKTHFVVHNHPNNAMGIVDMAGLMAPRIFELTFLSRSRSLSGTVAQTPNHLDVPNVSYMPPLTLDQCWIPRA